MEGYTLGWIAEPVYGLNRFPETSILVGGQHHHILKCEIHMAFFEERSKKRLQYQLYPPDGTVGQESTEKGNDNISWATVHTILFVINHCIFI